MSSSSSNDNNSIVATGKLVCAAVAASLVTWMVLRPTKTRSVPKREEAKPRTSGDDENASACKNAEQKFDLASLLRREEVTYGTLMVSPLRCFAAAAAAVGNLHFVFIDTEHIPLDRGVLENMCALYRARGLAPLVRVPRADAVLARAVLDAGAAGVVASYMETVEQVQELRKAVKLKPLQGALLHTAMNDPERFAREHPKTKAFVEARQNPIALVINIESQAAIDNMEAMLAVPGVDAVLVGPHDLSCNLGVPEDFEHPKFQNALKTIFQKARKAGVGAGIHQGMPPTPGMTLDYAQKWIQEYGCNVYVHSADVNLFAAKLGADLATLGAKGSASAKGFVV